MAQLNAKVQQVTDRIIERSGASRQRYLDHLQAALDQGPHRRRLSCGNLAHGFAACSGDEKSALAGSDRPNIAIVSSYNDMLSAHEPYRLAPALIKEAVHAAGGVAQFAGGVPAMCDGVTQGQPGMELSLFSRDVIAQATAVALSHNMFDGALYLGVCDKIVPGLLIGALTFGHLPAVFVPAGPMPSGLPNKEKVRIRQLYAEGKVGREELLQAESKSYHSSGTCTFYGTANSNQMMVEIMGLHLPGSSFINPYTPLRDELTKAAARQVVKFTAQGEDFRPIGHLINEKAIVNAIIGLLATGGSTNHTIHLIAIARAAGILVNWDDFNELSHVIPLLTRIYPNGQADINHFQAAGGMGVLIAELLSAGLLHGDIITIGDDRGLHNYNREPQLRDGQLCWQDSPSASLDQSVLSSCDEPFDPTGGLHLVQGNLGRGVVKVSAVAEEHRVVEAPAIVFDDQDDLVAAFKAGKLEQDFVAVVRFQGPRAIGMPELHKLTPPLGVLQDRGFKVALVTDGRMSGASGKVPAAIHLSPECADGGPLAKVRSGDMVRFDANTGELNVLVEASEFDSRIPLANSASDHSWGMGRELFGGMRRLASASEEGACTLFTETPFS
ncbi:phosphogluconate dehydratase [Pseudomaricurvus sp. HS19]|uniref:phosphogluconate dehydratase n=1 Tax=Pseudomaricurvus sp. HS19 TaxID=2692626 RepID=UPI001371A1DD|nr:phosphogluconate dehydratase [Pseudomaricurvus sp. HS19]MYM61761.1 phosphogluconate dehydratase [Pseudomaricurvus sp. HS19]